MSFAEYLPKERMYGLRVAANRAAGSWHPPFARHGIALVGTPPLASERRVRVQVGRASCLTRLE